MTWPVAASALLIATFAAMAIFGPHFLGLGNDIDPAARLEAPDAAHWFGTDSVGRDIFVRTISGSRNSLWVGVVTAVATLVVGGALGLLAGYFRAADAVLMRISDGLMAIPSVLLAIAMVSVLGSGLGTVILAITVPEVPRTARLMRSVVLTLRELPFVAAAVSVGSSTAKILFRHVIPNAVGALTVQATFVCASAVLSEAVLSFLGVGTPPDVPSWGNVMASGRQYFQVAPWIILFPGAFLSLVVLSINILGDHLREVADPRLKKRLA
ncbi:MAG: ABC transporter permease [Burkholderiales bacterium]|nr:ABC transporter permease [Burkholderiales bacterium]